MEIKGLRRKTILLLIVLCSMVISARGQCNWNIVSDSITGDSIVARFGSAAAISRDGSTVAFGAHREAKWRGQVKVYELDSNGWKQKGNTLYGHSPYIYFGAAIALSAGGDTMAIGVPNSSSSANNAGEVIVYRYNSGSWTQLGSAVDGENSYDRFGTSVDLTPDGKTFIAGGPYARGASGGQPGHARVFTLGSNWTQVGNDLDGPHTGTGITHFGASSAISDSADVVIIGEHTTSGSPRLAGAAHIYELDSGTWKYRQKLSMGSASSYARFGTSVDMTGDGQIGAMGSYKGFVAFKKDTSGSYKQFGSWIRDTSGADGLGQSISMSHDGKYMIAGDYHNSGKRGAVQLFEFHNGDWRWKGDTKTIPDSLNDFGFAVSLSGDGSIAAVGDPLYNHSNKVGNGYIVEFDPFANHVPDTMRVASCEPFITPGGKKLDSTGNYLDTFKSATLCDSVLLVDFTRLKDTLAPVIVVKDDTITLNKNGTASINFGNIVISISEDCRLSNTWIDSTEFDCSELGQNTVTVYAQDLSGNIDSAKAVVTVLDLIPPNVGFSSNVIYLDTFGMAYGFNDSLATVNSSENCEIDSIWYSRDTFYCNELGLNSVQLILRDQSNNIDSTLIRVAVIDTFNSIDTVDFRSCLFHVLSNGRLIEYPGYYYDTLTSAGGCDSIVCFNISLQNNLYGVFNTIYGNTQTNFGYAFDLSEDGSVMAVTALEGTSNSKGDTRVYAFQNSKWVQLGKVIEGEKSLDRSGYSVSVSDYGNAVAIGSIYNRDNGTNAGHVRVFQYMGASGWQQLGPDIDGNAGDWCGFSVDLSKNGQIVAIGAPRSNSRKGAVRVYEYRYATSSWRKRGNDIVGDVFGDEYGRTVKLSYDGDRVASSTSLHKGSGQAKVFEWSSGSWNQIGSDIVGLPNEALGLSLSMDKDGNTLVLGSIQNSGKVKMYNLDSNKWVLSADSLEGGSGDDFGAAVALSHDGKTVAVGAPRDNGGSGKITIYRHTSYGWKQSGSAINGLGGNNWFGQRAAISGNGYSVVGGNPSSNLKGTASGLITSYNRWVQINQDPDTVFGALCNGTYTTRRGKILRTSGTYQDTFQSVLGCDSILTYQIGKNVNHFNYIDTTTCDSFITPLGKVLTESQELTESINLKSAPCDSLIFIDATINHSSLDTISVADCGLFTSDQGIQYMESGRYLEMLTNQVGCDSTITLDVTVYPVPTDSIKVSTCDFYFPPSKSRAIYNSGIYMDTLQTIHGCDSFIYIDAKIGSTTRDSLFVNTCDRYVSPKGKTYTSSAVFTDTFTNSTGCDSFIYVELFINKNTDAKLFVNSCDSFVSPTGKVWSNSGIYMDTISNRAGCDSIMEFNVHIDRIQITSNPIDVNVEPGEDLFFFAGATPKDSIDFQWQISIGGPYVDLINDSKYSGVSSDSLRIKNVAQSDHGNRYRCRINGSQCSALTSTATIAIILAVDDLKQTIKYYPNPVLDFLTIEVSEVLINRKYVVYDVNGKMLVHGQIDSKSHPIDLRTIPPGSYLLKVDGITGVRFVKSND